MDALPTYPPASFGNAASSMPFIVIKVPRPRLPREVSVLIYYCLTGGLQAESKVVLEAILWYITHGICGWCSNDYTSHQKTTTLIQKMGNACSNASDDDLELLVRLQCGLSGGFGGPNPNEIHVITKYTYSSSIVINSLVRSSTSDPLTPLRRRVPISEICDTARALADVRAILEGIPTERPRGSEDIYGEDTVLRWESEDFVWFNGVPEGCAGGGRSWVQPTEKEKEGFKRAIEIIKDLVKVA